MPMQYDQKKLTAVLGISTFERDVALLTEYFSVFHEFRVRILNILYDHPTRATAIMGRPRMESDEAGLWIIPWHIDDAIHEEPFDQSNAQSFLVGPEIMKYFALKGADYWRGRQVHDVGCGTAMYDIYLVKMGATVIARTAGGESLVLAALNLVENNCTMDFDFGLDHKDIIEINSDTYIFHGVLNGYGMGQMNVDTMRYLASLGKEVIFTAPYNIRADKYPRWQTNDLQPTEYEIVLETGFYGDPEEWGPREVLRML